jgi:hypothetical protein
MPYLANPKRYVAVCPYRSALQPGDGRWGFRLGACGTSKTVLVARDFA